MSTARIRVTVHGDGAVADRIAERAGARPDLALVARTSGAEQPPSGTDCVIYAPAASEIAADAPKTAVPNLLRAGFDVVTTLPLDERLPEADILDACRAGESTFHASAGFQSAVAIRVVRTVAEVTRDIRRVELIEELRVPESGVYPWGSRAETGLGTSDGAAAEAAARSVAGYYEAGLRILDEAVFGDAAPGGAITVSVEAELGESGTVERIGVRRELSERIGYHSIWTAAEPAEAPEAAAAGAEAPGAEAPGAEAAEADLDRPPLRYRLVSATDGASGATTVDFRFISGLHPADHLTVVDALDALRSVAESEPGIARRDLAITYLKSDERLRR